MSPPNLCFMVGRFTLRRKQIKPLERLCRFPELAPQRPRNEYSRTPGSSVLASNSTRLLHLFRQLVPQTLGQHGNSLPWRHSASSLNMTAEEPSCIPQSLVGNEDNPCLPYRHVKPSVTWLRQFQSRAAQPLYGMIRRRTSSLRLNPAPYWSFAARRYLGSK